VLEIDGKEADPLSTYSASVWLPGGKLLREDYATLIDEAGTVTIRVSESLDEKSPIVNGEFIRLRHRNERYEKLPIRLDLKPEDPKPQPVAPVLNPFRIR
jgi:hypothetical protein